MTEPRVPVRWLMVRLFDCPNVTASMMAWTTRRRQDGEAAGARGKCVMGLWREW